MLEPRSFDDNAQKMFGESDAYKRLEWLIAKYSDESILDLIRPIIKNKSTEPNELDDELNNTELTAPSQTPNSPNNLIGLEKLLWYYFQLPPNERSPDDLGAEGKDILAIYCATFHAEVSKALTKSFRNWINLLNVVYQEPYLNTQCKPTEVDSFIRLADQVCTVLGFRSDERPLGTLVSPK